MRCSSVWTGLTVSPFYHIYSTDSGAIAALDINKEGGKAITPILLLPENDSSAPIPAAVAGGFVLYATGEGKVEGARATSGERAGRCVFVFEGCLRDGWTESVEWVGSQHKH